MMLRELLLVSYCAVLWVLFTVPFQSFVLCHLVSALKKLKTDEFRPRGITTIIREYVKIIRNFPF